MTLLVLGLALGLTLGFLAATKASRQQRDRARVVDLHVEGADVVAIEDYLRRRRSRLGQ